WEARVLPALRRIGNRAPAALADFHDTAPHAGPIRRARRLERRVCALHIEPRARARVVLLDLVVAREARRASRPRGSGGSPGDRPGWRAYAAGGGYPPR